MSTSVDNETIIPDGAGVARTIPDGAHRIISDVVHWLSEEIIVNPNQRLDHWHALEYFWNKLDDSNCDYGPMYCRYRLAKVVAAACHTDPYDDFVDPKPLTEKKSLLKPPLSLVQWSHRHWIDLGQLLIHTRDACIRKDAVDYGFDDPQPDPNRADSDIYHSKLDSLLRYVRINQALSKFRWTLEQQIRHDKDARPKVDAATLHEFGTMIQEEFHDDETALQALEALVIRGQPGTSTRSGGVSLKSLDELAPILRIIPFSLYAFQKKLDRLMKKWMRDLFPTPPTLSRLGYQMDSEADDEDAIDVEVVPEDEEIRPETPPQKSPKVSAIENNENKSPSKRGDLERKRKSTVLDVAEVPLEKLQNARQILHDEGQDPLKEICALADTATAREANIHSSAKQAAAKKRKTTLYEKKASARKVLFEESDDDDSGVKLSDVPVRAKVQTPQKVVGSPDRVLHAEDGTRKRYPFSEDEKRAIREGIKKFGLGKWSDIKSAYAIILRNRTNVNIKDCYRTMVKKGEV